MSLPFSSVSKIYTINCFDSISPFLPFPSLIVTSLTKNIMSGSPQRRMSKTNNSKPKLSFLWFASFIIVFYFADHLKLIDLRRLFKHSSKRIFQEKLCKLSHLKSDEASDKENCFLPNIKFAYESDFNFDVITKDHGLQKNNFESVDFSKLQNLMTIGEKAFANNDIKEVVFGDRSNIKFIKTDAFSNNSIKFLRIPHRVVKIERSAFSNNIRLKGGRNVCFEGRAWPKVVSEIDTKSATFEIEQGAFDELFIDSQLEFSRCPCYSNNNKSAACLSGDVVFGLLECGATGGTSNDGSDDAAKCNWKIPDYFSHNAMAIESVDLSGLSYLNTVGEYAFDKNMITAVKLPVSVQGLAKNCFKENEISSLNHDGNVVNLNDVVDLKTIYEGAFENNQISSLILPNSIDYIGNNAFKGNKIQEINFQDFPDLNDLQEHVFSNNEIRSITLQNMGQLRTIHADAFAQNPIEEVHYESLDILETVEKHSFEKTSKQNSRGWRNKLERVTIRECKSLAKIDDYAFAYNEIKSLELYGLNRLEFIGQSAFESNSIENLKLPKSVITIEADAFAKNNIYDVNFHELKKLELLLEGAFRDNSLSKVKIVSDKLAIIEDRVFQSNSIFHVDLSGATALVEIEDFAFANNPIKYVNLPPNLKKIGKNAFKGAKIKGVLRIPPEVSYIGEYAFAADKEEHHEFDVCFECKGFLFDNCPQLTISKKAFYPRKLDDFSFSSCSISNIMEYPTPTL